MRLSEADKDRIRADHPLVDVLHRIGIEPPNRWDGQRDFMVCCPMPGHPDTNPSMIIHPVTDRYHCFGCGAHGDVLQLVMSIEGITSLAKAAELLEDHRPVTAHASAAGPARVASMVERPDLSRTEPERILAANREAWRYLTLPRLAERGRQYLADRGLDVSALEAEIGRPAVGHTPWSETGLIDQLRRRGFSNDELVDSGWASRRQDETMVDRYRSRVMIPVRNDHDQVIGVYGRDGTGRARAKYLNTPDTAVFKKGRALYRPSSPNLSEQATVIVCEGSIDALAIATRAATSGLSSLYAPVSPSGTALTLHQAKEVLRLGRRAPLVCADGDSAGLAAAAKWAETFVIIGRETVAIILPEALDPAEWVARNGSSALNAFAMPACLSQTGMRAVPAGAIIAHAISLEATKTRRDEGAIREATIRRLGQLGAQLSTGGARARFADSAAQVLAQSNLGPDGWLACRISSAIDMATGGGGAMATPRPEVAL